MTIQEFHIAFDLELDKTLDFEYAYIQPEQKDYWLNKAQEQFIKDRAYPKDKRRDSFEESQKRIDDLRTIVVEDFTGVNATVDSLNKRYSITLPINYNYLVGHECETISTCGREVVSGFQTKHDANLTKDPFWKPIHSQPLYYIVSNKIIYLTDGFAIGKVFLSYIKKEQKMRLGSSYQNPTDDVDSELPSHTHQEILDMAVSMVLENIESSRYQSNLNELNKIN